MTHERKDETNKLRHVGDIEIFFDYVYVYIEAIRTHSIFTNAVQLAIRSEDCIIIKDTVYQASTTIILKYDAEDVLLMKRKIGDVEITRGLTVIYVHIQSAAKLRYKTSQISIDSRDVFIGQFTNEASSNIRLLPFVAFFCSVQRETGLAKQKFSLCCDKK